MNFEEAIDKRRSIRYFESKDVGEDLILKLIECASKAPSPGNLQPWHFIIVRKKEIINEIAKLTYSGFSEENPPQEWIVTAPTLIVVCATFRSVIARYGEAGRVQGLLSMGAAIENLLLAATNYGLGACWVGGFRKGDLSKLLKLSKDVESIAIIPVAYPKKIFNPPPKLPLTEIVTAIS